MSDKIEEIVSVKFLFKTKENSPQAVVWNNRLYPIDNVGLHYTLHRGNVLFHMFAVTSKQNYLLLSFNTHSLIWKLEEVAEYTAN